MKETEFAELEEAVISRLLIISLVYFPELGVRFDPLKIRFSPATKDLAEDRSVVIIGVTAGLKVNLQLEVQFPSSETR